jgi:hypothetical protein
MMWAGMDLIYECINVCLSEGVLEVPRIAVDLIFWIIANILLVSSHAVTKDQVIVNPTSADITGDDARSNDKKNDDAIDDYPVRVSAIDAANTCEGVDTGAAVAYSNVESKNASSRGAVLDASESHVRGSATSREDTSPHANKEFEMAGLCG